MDNNSLKTLINYALVKTLEVSNSLLKEIYQQPKKTTSKIKRQKQSNCEYESIQQSKKEMIASNNRKAYEKTHQIMELLLKIDNEEQTQNQPLIENEQIKINDAYTLINLQGENPDIDKNIGLMNFPQHHSSYHNQIFQESEHNRRKEQGCNNNFLNFNNFVKQNQN